MSVGVVYLRRKNEMSAGQRRDPSALARFFSPFWRPDNHSPEHSSVRRRGSGRKLSLEQSRTTFTLELRTFPVNRIIYKRSSQHVGRRPFIHDDESCSYATFMRLGFELENSKESYRYCRNRATPTGVAFSGPSGDVDALSLMAPAP